MLSQAEIAALYAPREARTGKKGKGFVMVRTEDGLSKQVIEKMGDHDFGAFEGKVGTMRRSTKGRTRRMPNGSRRYVRSWFAEDAVVAYSLRK